jgi:hypothetical protein
MAAKLLSLCFFFPYSIAKKVIAVAFFLFFFCNREKKATMATPSFVHCSVKGL